MSRAPEKSRSRRAFPDKCGTSSQTSACCRSNPRTSIYHCTERSTSLTEMAIWSSLPSSWNKDCARSSGLVKIAPVAVKVYPPDRREFLRLLAGATLASALPSWSRAAGVPAQDLVTISILHTTDLHGHILPTTDYDGRPDLGGLARCITQIHRWRSENPHTLFLDIGDVYQGTQFALSDQGRSMVDLFNLLRTTPGLSEIMSSIGGSILSFGRWEIADAGPGGEYLLEGNRPANSATHAIHLRKSGRSS